MTQTSILKFVLDGKIVHLDLSEGQPSKPTTTVLNYLRSLPNHKGVKEGCAEGDCGACSVVIAELNDHGKLSYNAFDSCLIMLPMLDGKQLITVENVGTSDSLHPVQKAMVDSDGSQCGYCTPGFIMSMFALYKNHEKPSRAVIDDALTGNLCRCTGYRPIVEAATKACAVPMADSLSESEGEIIKLLHSIQQKKCSLSFHATAAHYDRPYSLEEALKLKKEFPEALFNNGATDNGLILTKKKIGIASIIDLGGIKELKTIEVKKDELIVGSGASLEQLKQACKKSHPALFDTLKVFGSLQIRNFATLGGNIGSASPIGDTPPILMAYKARIVLESLRGKREMLLEDFITGYRQTDLKDDELIYKIIIPKAGKGVKINWYKISKRKDLDISTVSAGFRVQIEKDKVEDIALFYGGMAEKTKRASKTEQVLKDQPWTQSVVEKAMKAVDDDFTPISDARASAAGRKVMARNLLMKFWSDTTKN